MSGAGDDDSLTDEQFIEEFERCGFERSGFAHRSHVRMAWIYVRHLGLSRAVDRATAGIRKLAVSKGQSQLYHDTITRAWVYLVAAAVSAAPDVDDFQEFVEREPRLLDKTFIADYYSPPLLSSAAARAGWQPPDRRPIPGALATADVAVDVVHPAPIRASRFRAALEAIPRAVAVMTARDALRVHGTTVSSVVPASMEPPLLMVCLRSRSRLLDIVDTAGVFGISFLAQAQTDVAARFADPDRATGKAQFAGVDHMLGRYGAPLITGGPARFECMLVHSTMAGDQRVICGSVVDADRSQAVALGELDSQWV